MLQSHSANGYGWRVLTRVGVGVQGCWHLLRTHDEQLPGLITGTGLEVRMHKAALCRSLCLSVFLCVSLSDMFIITVCVGWSGLFVRIQPH